MRETLTRQVKQALDRAQSEARLLKQDFVGTEHLALGLLGDDNADAVRAVRRQSLDVDDLRRRITQALPVGKEEPVVTGALPLSPKATRAVNQAVVKAQSLHEPSVSTRVVLLALLEEPENAMCRLLREAGADTDILQRHLAEKPDEPEE